MWHVLREIVCNTITVHCTHISSIVSLNIEKTKFIDNVFIIFAPVSQINVSQHRFSRMIFSTDMGMDLLVLDYE